MAAVKVTIPRKASWSTQDKLVLFKGTENAASLAASTPAGGTRIDDRPAWEAGERRGRGSGVRGQGLRGYGPGSGVRGLGHRGDGLRGLLAAERVTLEHRHNATDVCAQLPVGVKVEDEAGNLSTVVEAVASIKDRPRGPRNLAVGSTGNKNEARLTWTGSPDIESE